VEIEFTAGKAEAMSQHRATQALISDCQAAHGSFH
jgi:hypothetical protein